MDILNTIKEFFFGKGVRIEDSFFGEITDTGDTFEFERYFKNTKQKVELILEKNGNEVTLNQVAFYKKIENDYKYLVENMIPLIEKELDGWIENYDLKYNFKKDFRLECIHIPKCDEEIIRWEISYWMNNDAQHWCTLEMKNFEVNSIIIDG